MKQKPNFHLLEQAIEVLEAVVEAEYRFEMESDEISVLNAATVELCQMMENDPALASLFSVGYFDNVSSSSDVEILKDKYNVIAKEEINGDMLLIPVSIRLSGERRVESVFGAVIDYYRKGIKKDRPGS